MQVQVQDGQKIRVWQVDLTGRAKYLMAFRTPNRRVFRWLVMPFGIANAPALFQELMNQVLTILKQRPTVQALLERGAVAEAHIDDVLLGTNSIEDRPLLLTEFFEVCLEQNLRIKLEKCEFLKTELEYLGFRVGDGHWGPCEDKLKSPGSVIRIRSSTLWTHRLPNKRDHGDGGYSYLNYDQPFTTSKDSKTS